MDFPMDDSILLWNPDFPISNPKGTMRNLNDRLADFMKHCYDLEKSNLVLQKKIEERVKEFAPVGYDWQKREKESNDLLQSIGDTVMLNAAISLDIDNNLMELTLLKERLYHEQFEHKDILQKKKLVESVLEEVKLSVRDIEFAINDKMAELKDLKLSHQEAVQAVQQLIPPIDEIQFAVVEDGSRMELSQLLNEIRTHYESLISSSQMPLDLSTNTQLEEEARKKMEKEEEELREARANLNEARRQWKSLQVEIDTLQALERSLKYTLQATKQQHQKQLKDLAEVIVDLEQELKEVRQGIRIQLQKHKMLLNTNMKLEQEISAYRTLLEREEKRLVATDAEKFQEQKPSTSRIAFAFPPGISWDSETDASQNQSETCIEESGSWFSEDDESSSVDKIAESDNEFKQKWPMFNGKIEEEGLEASGTVQTAKVDKVIKEWEGSFFKDNPKLRKKSVSLRFDLHLAAADEQRPQAKEDNLKDIEVRLVMRRSCSIPTLSP
ncbi:keratin-like protein KRT222 isoform X2 [Xenopus laevis]|nr:keratin-like protein KRT222 isoform X2 [Xenopus laevis]